MSFAQRVLDAVDRQLPAVLKESDLDTVRRARLGLMFAWGLTALAPVFVLNDIRDGRWGNAAGILWAVPLGLATPWVLRRWPSLTLLGHWVAAIFGAVLMARTLMTGGITAFAPFWMSSLPVFAALIAGRQHAFVWLAVDTAFFVGIRVATGLGASWMDVWTPHERQNEFVIANAMLATLMLGLASLFEAAKDRMRLELSRREDDIRRMLDLMGQGFVTVAPDGTVRGPWSQAVETFFASPTQGAPIADVIEPVDARGAAWLALSFDALATDMLPLSVVLDQFPTRLRSGDRTLSLVVKPVTSASGKLHALVLVFTDLSAELEREAAERAQREVLALIEKVAADRSGVVLFLREGERLVAAIEADGELRDVHTLKGNAGLFGASTIAALCHELETETIDAGRSTIEPSARDAVRRAWRAFRTRVSAVVDDRHDIVQVPADHVRRLEDALRRGAPPVELAAEVHGWLEEPVRVPLLRLANQARSLAVRLGKADPHIDVIDHDVRLAPERFAPVWSVLAHVVRNAVDHGVERPEERVARGVSEQATLTFEARVSDGELSISIGDDGRGIAWERVAERASALGLPHGTRADLEAALFSEGFSTAVEVTEVSGRGIGLGAVASMCRAYEGTIEVASEPGRGTRFTLRFPTAANGQVARGASVAA